MNNEQFSAKWQKFKNKIKATWNKLTDQDIEQVHGKKEHLSAHLRKKYGWTSERADKEINDWCSSCDSDKNCSQSRDEGRMGQSHNPNHKEENRNMHQNHEQGRMGQSHNPNHKEENRNMRQNHEQGRMGNQKSEHSEDRNMNREEGRMGITHKKEEGKGRESSADHKNTQGNPFSKNREGGEHDRPDHKDKKRKAS